MASINFKKGDVGLYSDVLGTLVTLPRLTAASWNRTYEGTTLKFYGDTWGTPVSGEGQSESHEMSVLFAADEHDTAKALKDLFDRAHGEFDRRLQFRAHTSSVAGHALYVVGAVFNLRGDPQPARPVTLSWTVQRVGDEF